MNTETNLQNGAARAAWTWERWIALLAFAVAALVRAGLFKHFPW